MQQRFESQDEYKVKVGVRGEKHSNSWLVLICSLFDDEARRVQGGTGPATEGHTCIGWYFDDEARRAGLGVYH